MYDDSMVRIHRIYRISQCKWLSDFPTVRETIVNSFPSPEKFWFTTGTIESMEWLNLVPRQRMWTEHPHTAYFLAHLRTFHPCSHARMAQGVAACVSWKHVHPHVIMSLIVRCLSIHWPLPLFWVSLPFVPFSSSPLSWSHPPCGRNRRVLDPLRAPA